MSDLTFNDVEPNFIDDAKTLVNFKKMRFVFFIIYFMIYFLFINFEINYKKVLCGCDKEDGAFHIGVILFSTCLISSGVYYWFTEYQRIGVL